MIISLKSNKTCEFIANHVFNRQIFDEIGLKPIKVKYLKEIHMYNMEGESYIFTPDEIKSFFHVIKKDVEHPFESVAVADEEAEIPQFPIFASKRVTVNIKECSVNGDNLEDFIKELREKFK